MPSVGCEGAHGRFYKNVTLRNITINDPRISTGVLIGSKTSLMQHVVFDSVRAACGAEGSTMPSFRATFPMLPTDIADRGFYVRTFLLGTTSVAVFVVLGLPYLFWRLGRFCRGRKAEGKAVARSDGEAFSDGGTGLDGERNGERVGERIERDGDGDGDGGGERNDEHDDEHDGEHNGERNSERDGDNDSNGESGSSISSTGDELDFHGDTWLTHDYAYTTWVVTSYLPTVMTVLLSVLIFILFRTELHPSSYPWSYYKVPSRPPLLRLA